MKSQHTELVIVGAGPGGYSAAFLAAAKGVQVSLVDLEKDPGGVCLLRGCIPSKAYLHATELIERTRQAGKMGIHFKAPDVDPSVMLKWQEEMVHNLAEGLSARINKAGIERLNGRVVFESDKELRVETEGGQERLTFDHSIICTGSRPLLPEAMDLGNPRIMTSREALRIEDIPDRLLVVGGGYIGLEMGTVYARLGASVTLVEAMDTLLPGTDKDLVRPVASSVGDLLEEIFLETKVEGMRTNSDRIEVSLNNGDSSRKELFDKVLVAVGRIPNTEKIGLEGTGVRLDENNFITTNHECRTSVDRIFAVGDVAGGEMLAHKAAREGRKAVRAICGESVAHDPRPVPAVVYTSPEIAWVGLTEKEAKEQDLPISVAKCPWKRIGRAHGLASTEGLTKLVMDAENQRVLGVGMVGAHAGELISEGVLAVEMGATAEDLVETTHPHPTLAESIQEAAASIYRE